MTVTTRVFVACALGACGLLAATARAQQQPPHHARSADESATTAESARRRRMAGIAEAVMTTGTIVVIDRDRRLVVLRDQAGDQLKVQVPPDLPTFEELHKGEKVDVAYYDSVAVSVMRPGAGPPTAESRVNVEPPQAGGLVGHEVTVTAQLVDVDTKSRAINLKLPGGQTQRVSLADPSFDRQMRDWRPGQMLSVTYTEAMAASIQPVLPSR